MAAAGQGGYFDSGPTHVPGDGVFFVAGTVVPGPAQGRIDERARAVARLVGHRIERQPGRPPHRAGDVGHGGVRAHHQVEAGDERRRIEEGVRALVEALEGLDHPFGDLARVRRHVVAVDHLAELDARIVARGDDVDRRVAHGHIEPDMRVLGQEARDKDVQVVLGPTINLHRSPLGGRHFECMSEDPLLTGVLADVSGSLGIALLLPATCYAVIAGYGIYARRPATA